MESDAKSGDCTKPIVTIKEMEYNNLLYQISKRLDELNVGEQLLVMCRGKVTARSGEDFQTFSLLKNLKNLNRNTVYKGGAATDPGNYRPIATLSPFSKVLERLVYNQLYSFIDKHQILYKYQFGFRKGYSTEQAILEITDNRR